MQNAANFIGNDLAINVDQVQLGGFLNIPDSPLGLIIFAHGSGSSRLSHRNQFVACQLHLRGFATLLFDLLTQEEELVDSITRDIRFNISLLAHRLELVTQWAAKNNLLSNLEFAYFGASTGAAAALIAATESQKKIRAIVSRGGRPDLAKDVFEKVTTPTLLIVGGSDYSVLVLNQQAKARMKDGIAEIAIVPGASHLFEEPGALEQVAKIACSWFESFLFSKK